MELENSEDGDETESGRKAVFSAETEEELELLLFIESRLFDLTSQDVKRLVFQLATRNDRKNNFSQINDTAVKTGLTVS
jgi:hypothetical protein